MTKRTRNVIITEIFYNLKRSSSKWNIMTFMHDLRRNLCRSEFQLSVWFQLRDAPRVHSQMGTANNLINALHESWRDLKTYSCSQLKCFICLLSPVLMIGSYFWKAQFIWTFLLSIRSHTSFIEIVMRDFMNEIF